MRTLGPVLGNVSLGTGEWEWKHASPYVVVIGRVIGNEFPPLERRGRESRVDLSQVVRGVSSILRAGERGRGREREGEGGGGGGRD